MSAKITASQVKAVAMPILKNRDINPAANSKFWLPLRGFYYFIRHPQLWKVVLLPICCALLIDFVGVILLFALALVPQAELFIPIEGMPEAVAWLIAVVLVLLECLLLVFVTATIVFEHWGEKLFEKTLDIEGVPHVENDKCCDGDCWMDFFRFSLFVMLLPLHFIPCLGTVLFCYLNGCMPTDQTGTFFLVVFNARFSDFPFFCSQFLQVGIIINHSFQE